MSLLPKNEIVKAALKGLKNAQKSYESWSGGQWLDSAPEYLITCEIAKSIDMLASKNNKKISITLEDNVRATLECTNGLTCGKHKKTITKLGRSDIVIWQANDMPRAIIEVKKGYSFHEKCKYDVKRIADMLLKGGKAKCGSLEFGVFAMYTSDENDNIPLINKRYHDFVSATKSTIEAHTGKTFKIDSAKIDPIVQDGGTWGAICIVITPN